MDITTYRSGLGLIGTGAILWIVGLLVSSLLPAVAAVGAVLVLFGKIIAAVGVLVLVVQVLVSLFRGL